MSGTKGPNSNRVDDADDEVMSKNKHRNASTSSSTGSGTQDCADVSILRAVRRSERLFTDNVRHSAPVVDSAFKWEVKRGFRGWGGWGDGRDSALCLWMAGVRGPWSE